MNERVGFVGLGIMGQGMARNLLKAGYNVRVWNRTSSRMDPLVEAGAAAGASPADVAANCDIIAVCVSDTPDVEEVISRRKRHPFRRSGRRGWSSISARSARRRRSISPTS